MFTIEQIDEAHKKVKSGADFPKYIQDLKNLWVTAYKVYVIDNHKDYYWKDDFKVISKWKYENLKIAKKYDKETFENALIEHQKWKTNYMQFCQMCAETWIESWFVCLESMNCTYYDINGNEVLVEEIPS